MSTALSPLLAPMLSSAAMRTICDDRSTLQHMLDFVAALARAEEATGVIPTSALGDRSGLQGRRLRDAPTAYQGASQALIDRLLDSLDLS